MSDNKTSSGGIGFLGLLTIAFIVLKLTKYIDWSWWGVLAPLWIPTALVFIGLAIYIPYKLWKNKDDKNRIRAGYNEWGWKNGGKSKWQQRLDEMHNKK